MTVQEWLSGLEYNSISMFLFNKRADGHGNKVLDLCGWAYLVSKVKTELAAEEFQAKVAAFIIEAINEKLENDKGIESAWKKIKEVLGDEDFIEKSINYNTKLGEVVVKFYKYCKKNSTKESEKFQINNLDWCKLILNEDKTVDVENEHNSRYSIIDLDVEELDIVLQLL